MIHHIIDHHIGKGAYTGKQDIDGTEICDGDIMEHFDTAKHPGNKNPYLIEWDDEEAGFKCENGLNYMLASMWCEMRVIGNKCANAELLERCRNYE